MGKERGSESFIPQLSLIRHPREGGGPASFPAAPKKKRTPDQVQGV